MPETQANFPVYSLYGENSVQDLREIVHCETIAARSGLYNWEISPHLHMSLWQVLFLQEGQADIRLGEAVHAIRGPRLVITPARLVHGFAFSPGAIGYVLSLSQDFVSALSSQDPLASTLAQGGLARPDAETTGRLAALGRQMVSLQPEVAGLNRVLLQRALAEAFLRIALNRREAQPPSLQERRAQSFQHLVERHYREHRPLSFYAQAMHCTERTLSRMCREVWGLSPRQILNNRLATEASRLLRFTNAGCSDVADELGFEDPSYFSRFYLRMTGRRPSAEKL